MCSSCNPAFLVPSSFSSSAELSLSEKDTDKMKTLIFLLLLTTIAAVVLGHVNPNHQSHSLPSRSHGQHTESQLHGSHASYRSVDGARAPTSFEKHLTPVPTSGIADHQPATRLPSHPHAHPQAFMPTSQPLSSTAAPLITHAVATHFERGGCPPGITLCPGDGVICCPFDSYCTTDGLGNEGCCYNGAVCSGLATTPRGSVITVAATPVHGAAAAHRPLKVFAFFAHILRLVTAMPAIERKAEDPSNEGPKIVSEALPPDTCGAPFCSASSGMPRPWRIFSVPVWFARRLAAAVLPIEERGSEALPPDTCGAPFCSAATRSQPRLMRVFTMPVLFAKGLVALALPANQQQDSSEVLAPDTCGAPFCSAATRSATNPLKFPVWFVAKASGLFSAKVVGSPVTSDAADSGPTSKASETLSEQHDCGDTVPGVDKNAREGLGVGSALVSTWGMAREKTAMVVGGFRQHMRGMRSELLGWY